MTAGKITADSEHFDVAIIGLGPVGQSLAMLLALRGHKVLAIEKHDVPYPMPRAVHYDPDVARLLDQLGVSDYILEFSSPTEVYEWQNADRETMISFTFPPGEGEQGWWSALMFNQPGLEDRLRERGNEIPNITFLRGTELLDLEQTSENVELLLKNSDGTSKATAQYVVGCDGANSFVREKLGTEVEDLGFFYRWLIVDIIPPKDRIWEPDNLQICDPLRPVTAVNGGPGRRRFEFMEMPTDDPDTFDSDENAWKLLEEWDLTPENTVLERRKVYQFQARWAKEWRNNRVFLAGDAAHQVPPFYGQGMVAGMRDSVNLAWKLDLVLSGVSTPELLDTYGSERGGQVQFTIWMSVELGRVICQTDPQAVAERDQHFLSRGPKPEDVLPPLPPERLGPGAFPIPNPAEVSDSAGVLSVNGRVQFPDGEINTVDRKNYGGFQLIVDGHKISEEELNTALQELPSGLNLLAVRVLPPEETPVEGTHEVRDLLDRYVPWLRNSDEVARIIRPDFYIYGSAKNADELNSLVKSLTTSLHIA